MRTRNCRAYELVRKDTTIAISDEFSTLGIHSDICKPVNSRWEASDKVITVQKIWRKLYERRNCIWTLSEFLRGIVLQDHMRGYWSWTLCKRFLQKLWRWERGGDYHSPAGYMPGTWSKRKKVSRILMNCHALILAVWVTSLEAPNGCCS